SDMHFPRGTLIGLMLRSIAKQCVSKHGAAPILRDASLRDAPQRLCSFSSGLPLFFVPEHGVEDGHDLPSDGDEGHHFPLTLSAQALVEGTQHWIAADGGKRRQEDGRTGSWAAAANHALAFPLAGSARERRNPNKACDLAAVETTELGHIGEDAAGDCVADAREGDQQVLFFA